MHVLYIHLTRYVLRWSSLFKDVFWMWFAVNIFTCAHTQTAKHILATPTCISSLTTLEAHSLCHSLPLSLSLLDHDVCWNDDVKDVHMHSFAVIIPPQNGSRAVGIGHWQRQIFRSHISHGNTEHIYHYLTQW